MPNFSPLVTVADTILPEPSTYEGNTGTIVDSARNTEGRMIGAVIRDDVAKVSMTWKYLTVEQWSAINRLFRTSSGGSFINSVTFFDQTEGDYVTRDMYVNDRKASQWIRDANGNVQGWQNCSLALIEV